MRGKLKYFGHVKRHECIERYIYEGIVEAGGGEADHGGGGATTNRTDLTQPSPKPDVTRTSEMLSDELSKTQRAGEHLPPRRRTAIKS